MLYLCEARDKIGVLHLALFKQFLVIVKIIKKEKGGDEKNVIKNA